MFHIQHISHIQLFQWKKRKKTACYNYVCVKTLNLINLFVKKQSLQIDDTNKLITLLLIYYTILQISAYYVHSMYSFS